MFVLLSSNAEQLFQRGILNALALPEDHPLEFRYQLKYVGEDIKTLLEAGREGELLEKHGAEALIVYAQCPDAASPNYLYCPVRFARIEALRLLGGIVFLGLRLQKFPNLKNWTQRPEGEVFSQWLVTRKDAVSNTTREGAFFSYFDRPGWDLSNGDQRDSVSWTSVVDELAQLPTMHNCLFYRIRGFFYQPRTSFLGKLLARKPQLLPENPIQPRSAPGSLTFPIGMSKAVELKLLVYRPKHHLPASTYPNTIKGTFVVEADKSGFSDIPSQDLQLESRYNELVLRLVTKRVFDNTLAPVSIRFKDSEPKDVLASQPLLLCTVDVSAGLLWVLMGCFVLASILLATSADDIKWLLDGAPSDPDSLGARLAVYAKIVGGVIAALGAFIAFRRFPLK